MKNRAFSLIVLLLGFVLLAIFQGWNSDEDLIEIGDSNFYIRLPDNYAKFGNLNNSIWMVEGIKIEGTLVPLVYRSDFTISIGPTTFEVSAFQRGPIDFDPLEMFNDNYSEPERIDSNEFEIYLAKFKEQKQFQVQRLVWGVVVERRTGIGISAHGDFSSQNEAYLVVKEILQSIRKIND